MSSFERMPQRIAYRSLAIFARSVNASFPSHTPETASAMTTMLCVKATNTPR
jgi:hypothetical protein